MSTPAVTYSDIGMVDDTVYPGTGNLNAAPDFVSNTNYRLLDTSPCIDAANGDAAPTTDFDDNPRYDDTSVTDTGVGSPTYTDMGAFEFQG